MWFSRAGDCELTLLLSHTLAEPNRQAKQYRDERDSARANKRHEASRRTSGCIPGIESEIVVRHVVSC
jgi:hypothetical protein